MNRRLKKCKSRQCDRRSGVSLDSIPDDITALAAHTTAIKIKYRVRQKNCTVLFLQ